jgi:PBS lyase HEAT-like repeat
MKTRRVILALSVLVLVLLTGFILIYSFNGSSEKFSRDPGRMHRSENKNLFGELPVCLLNSFSDTSIPLAKRQAGITALAARGDEKSVKILMQLGDSNTYLNFKAVEALGAVKLSEDSPVRREVCNYLLKKMKDKDQRIVCSALGSSARMLGRGGIVAISEAIRSNRIRNDGFEDVVLSEAVRALARIGDASAVSVLCEELKRADSEGWSLEYGSELVRALEHLGGRQAISALAGYADLLSSRLPGDPLARDYFSKKINEARKASSGT